MLSSEYQAALDSLQGAVASRSTSRPRSKQAPARTEHGFRFAGHARSGRSGRPCCAPLAAPLLPGRGTVTRQDRMAGAAG